MPSHEIDKRKRKALCSSSYEMYLDANTGTSNNFNQ